MKKLFLAIVTIALLAPGVRMAAQGKYGADSAECIKYLSYYSEYFKQKNYAEALPNWRKAYSVCPPTANQNMLLNGTTLMRTLIAKNIAKPEYRKALIDTLFTLHRQRAEYYPKYAVKSYNNLGLDVANYLKDNAELAFKEYEDIIEFNGTKTSANVLLFDMNAAIEKFKAGTATTEEVINIYERNIGILTNVTAANETEASQNAKVKEDIESLFITSNVASCESLIELFTPRYEANPEDLALVTSIAKMMTVAEDCTSNDLFLKAVTSMHKLEPSYTSAYYLYRLNSSRGNIDEAIKYIEEAISFPESDNSTDAEYNYELALLCSKHSLGAKGVAAAKKAIELDESYAGKSYFVIGTIWGSTICKGGNEIETRAPYWVAVDYLQKAKAADESLAEDANNLIRQYTKYYPQTAEAFMYDYTDGQSYTVNCGGMTAVTTVRTQK